ncbi:MAG: GH1 family beta-glucosidase [Candidatus Elarobacter sp.]
MTTTFPPGFRWGVATAAYQIEGAWNDDGKGESIWDRFAHRPGTIKGHTNGDVACDSYHRWRDDVALLEQLHLGSYRFSISWPRVQPRGSGAAEQRGLDHYRRLIEALRAANIRPLPTLYHWDLPQALQERGGWADRDTFERFAEYAGLVTRVLGDVVDDWATFNEPWIFTRFGYLDGYHAPGCTDPDGYLRATHTVNLANGAAVRAIKAVRASLRVGCVYSVSPAVPASQSDDDRAAAEAFHAYVNRWFVDPARYGRYPSEAVAGDLPLARMGWRDGDERLVRAQLDWAGINYYFHQRVRAAPPVGVALALPFETVGCDDLPLTDFGWPINPAGLRTILTRMYDDCGRIPLEVTESGCSYGDEPDRSGRIPDTRRIAYLRDHLAAVAGAVADGVDVRGYHYWTLLDNFEWAEGTTQRFGLVHVDFRSLERTPKDSALWYSGVAHSGRLPE